MTALLVAVFTASLLGSLHCAGMCGPFVAFATLRVKGRSVPDRATSNSTLQIWYHGGRFVAYVTLGTVAGWLGATLNLGSSVLGLGKVAGTFAGLWLMALGFGRLAALIGLRLPTLPGESSIARAIAMGQAAAARMTPTRRALVIGLLTALLPCGWLYAFVAVATGTGHALGGALVLLVFWGGTVPVLLGIGAGLGMALRRARKSLQGMTALLVVALGLYSIVGRWDLSMSSIATPATTLDSAVERVAAMLGKGKTQCACHH